MTRMLGVGLDIVDRRRIEQLLERYGESFVRRICREGEVRIPHGPGRAAHVAGLFAAKEAAMKALGTGWTAGVGFREIEVFRRDTGAPALRLHGGARRRADVLGVSESWLSISHDGASAVAVVVLEGDRP